MEEKRRSLKSHLLGCWYVVRDTARSEYTFTAVVGLIQYFVSRNIVSTFFCGLIWYAFLKACIKNKVVKDLIIPLGIGTFIFLVIISIFLGGYLNKI